MKERFQRQKIPSRFPARTVRPCESMWPERQKQKSLVKNQFLVLPCVRVCVDPACNHRLDLQTNRKTRRSGNGGARWSCFCCCRCFIVPVL